MPSECKECGFIYHVEGYGDPANDLDGWTEDWYCPNCGEVE